MSRTLLRLLGWGTITILGFFAIMVLALNRGEEIHAIWMVVAGVCTLSISYRFYSKWLCAKVLAIDDLRAPPSVTHHDGKDFIPTHRWLVFGHHFAAIAGPGPLVGPVLAAQFGYLPGTIWLLIGATLGGGVHDAIVLFASIRRGGRSLGQMIKDEIGPRTGLLCIFATLTILIILLAVLALVVVKALAESPWGLFTISLTIPIALVMGVAMKNKPNNIGSISCAGAIGLLFAVVAGHFLPQFPLLQSLFTRNQIWLAWALMVYGFAASSLPMWLLLTPRDYLSTFLKLGTSALLLVAVALLNPVMKMPAITSFVDGTGPVVAGKVFPFVCITIACGAISGFHALIASGTTPKILPREGLVRSVGYGAMVVEMVVALMAMVAACSMEPGEYFAINIKGEPAAVIQKINAAGFPVTLEAMQSLAHQVGESNLMGRTGGAPTFAVGMAQIFSRAFTSDTAMALWYHFAVMFEALFILTTIDAGTRVGRFLLQDLLGHLWHPLGDTRSTSANTFASVLLVAAWGFFLYQGVIDPLGGINSLWPIFGIANQLLAVIGLSLGTTLLIKSGKVRYLAVTLVPLLFLTTVTFCAGLIKIFDADPRLGFLSKATELQAKLETASALEQTSLHQQIFNFQMNAVVTGGFLLLVVLIVGSCAQTWIQILRGKKESVLVETPFVAMGENI